MLLYVLLCIVTISNAGRLLVVHPAAASWEAVLRMAFGRLLTVEKAWPNSTLLARVPAPLPLLAHAELVTDRACLPFKSRIDVVPFRGNATLEAALLWVRDEAEILEQELQAFLESFPRNDTVERLTATPSPDDLIVRLLHHQPVVFPWHGLSNVSAASFDPKAQIWAKVADRNGQFEGAEDAASFPGNAEAVARIPLKVRAALEPHLDVVVPRPHHWQTTMGDFLARLRNTTTRGVPYVEYFPASTFDDLELPMPDAPRGLALQSTNVWLGGATTGRLHFDEFDNVNCVARGSKLFQLHHPWNNEWLYESHLRQGQLRYDADTDSFTRTLDEATTLVMSPVQLSKRNDPRYPLFIHERMVNVIVNAGECLLLPAWWWHEVSSTVDAVQGIALAVNQWWHPLRTKNFPCAECRPRFNLRRYGQLLRRIHEMHLQKQPKEPRHSSNEL